MTAAAYHQSMELAVQLGQIRREGDLFYFPSISDKSENEHCCGIYFGRVLCTCMGFTERKRCYHADKVRDYYMATDTQALVPAGPTSMPDIWRDPRDLERRLRDLAGERAVMQNFLKEVMIKDEDYGLIPGTGDKPSLYKAGAEKLNELYGYYPKIVDKHEEADQETGHCRYVIQVGLYDRGTGIQVAEHIGECSTRESKYQYRWEYDNKLDPALKDPAVLATFKKRSGHNSHGNWTQYRIPNDDLWSLWNTILKMAYKRAYVGATLQATRSGGIFMHSAADVESWAIEGEFRYTDEDDADPLGGEQTLPDGTVVDTSTGEVKTEPSPPPPAPAQRQQQRQQATKAPAQRQQQASTTEPRPNSILEALRLLGGKQGEAAYKAAIKAMGRLYETTVPNRLSAEQQAEFIRNIMRRYEGVGCSVTGEHAEPKYNAVGDLLCSACGDSLPDGPPDAGPTPDEGDQELSIDDVSFEEDEPTA